MEILKTITNFISNNNGEVLPENALLIDVRSPAEYNFSHFADAISLPMNQLAEKIPSLVPDKSAAIIVYCQSGIRSGTAKRQLANLGYTNVFNGGGIENLALRSKYKVVCSK